MNSGFLESDIFLRIFCILSKISALNFLKSFFACGKSPCKLSHSISNDAIR